MKPDPVVHLVCVMMLSRCSACHQGTDLKWGKTQRGETVTKVQGRAMRCSCTNIIVLSQLKVLFTVQYLPPVDVCVMCPASPSLTCFAVVAVEVLRKVQASNLLLKKLNTCGIYFSCSCWNTRNVLFFPPRFVPSSFWVISTFRTFLEIKRLKTRERQNLLNCSM